MQDKKVLIVEDEGVSALSLQAVLGKMGYTSVGIAYTGREAISMALDLKPDVILMDIHIKGDMDGIMATQKINEFSDVPVIYLTAYADDETASRALATRAQSYLIKPYNPRELYLAIELALLRTRMEKELRQSEERFRTLFENQQTGLLIIDPVTHTLIDANESAFSLIGARKEEILGKVCHNYVCPAEAGQCPITDLHETFDNAEHVLITTTGEKIPILKSVKQVEIGNKPYLVESFIDITGRKQAEEALLENAAYLKKRQTEYRNLVQLNTEAMLILDKDYAIVFANPAAENIFGRSSEELAGVPFGWPVTSGELTEIEIPRRDGTVALAEIRVSGISWEDKPAHMVIVRDITEHRKMEQKIRESEESFRGLFNTVGEAIFVLDVDGRFLEVNQGIKDMYGQPRDFFIGQPPIILFASGTFDLGQIINRVEQAFHDKPQHFEFTGCRSNGEVFPAECRFYRGLYFGRDVIIGLEIDITERKHAEAALRESEARNLAYIKEAAMRLKTPIEVIEQNITTMILDSESGDYALEEIIPQLRLQVKNMEQIRQNILDLNKAIVTGFKDLSPASKEFLTE